MLDTKISENQLEKMLIKTETLCDVLDYVNITLDNQVTYQMGVKQLHSILYMTREYADELTKVVDKLF